MPIYQNVKIIKCPGIITFKLETVNRLVIKYLSGIKNSIFFLKY